MNVSKPTEITTSTLSTDIREIDSRCIANNHIDNSTPAIEDNPNLAANFARDDSEVFSEFRT